MTTVDLFSGCGGLSLGFQKAGFDVVAALDNWDNALEVYRANFTHPAIKADLTDVDAAVSIVSGYRPDIIIGGPPCQDFSSAGKRDEDNGRGDLTISYARIVAGVRPQWFVMENVARIVKTRKLEQACAIFKSAGYGLTKTVLNASLCGVPQKRLRFFMVGKLGAEDDFMADELRAGLAEKEMTVADYFGDRLKLKCYYRHPRSYARRGIFSVDEPSPTVRGVNRPMPDGYQIRPNDACQSREGVRPLTTAERSEIQTFPPAFRFLGGKTVVEQMVGNAVPVNLARYVGRAVGRMAGVPDADLSRDLSRPLTTIFEPQPAYGGQ